MSKISPKSHFRVNASTLAFAMIVLAALCASVIRPGAIHSARPLSDIDPGSPGFPVALDLASIDGSPAPTGGGWRRATARIQTASNVLADAGEVRFFVGTYGPMLEAREFTIRDANSGTILFARDPGPIENNAEVRLKATNFGNAPARNVVGEYRMEVVFRGGVSLAIWAQVPGAGDESAKKNLLVSAGAQRGIMWGSWYSGQNVAAVSRIKLLTYMWDYSSIAILAGIAGLVLFAAPMIFGGYPAVLFMGIALLYSFLIPPFQAPDEPDHFLTLAEDVGGPAGKELADSALRLAKIGQFESIKFRPSVSFSAEDIGRPASSDWAEYITPTGSHKLRSPLAGILWPVLGRIVSGRSAADALIMMRLFNVFLLGAAFWLLCRLLAPQDSFYVGMSLLTIPTLSFFGMHWSNHALQLAATVAATGFAIRSIAGSPPSPRQMFFWGVVSGLAFVSGVTGIATFAVMVGIATITLICKPATSVREQLLRTMLFAVGSLAVLGAVASPEYLLEFTGRLGRWRTGPSALSVSVNPWPLVLGLVAAWVACLWAISLMLSRFAAIRSFLERVVRMQGALIWIAAGAWLIFLMISPFYPWPALPGFEDGQIPGTAGTTYAKLAVVSFLSGFGLGSGDPLVVKSFWGGFGWLDAYPPDWLLRLARLIPAVGISVLVIAAARHPRDRALGRIVFGLTVVTALVCLAVAALAFSTHRINVNLHGRYLAGIYVIFTATCALGLARGMPCLCRERSANAARQLLFLGVVLVHTVCWHSLIVRYLGSS